MSGPLLLAGASRVNDLGPLTRNGIGRPFVLWDRRVPTRHADRDRAGDGVD